MKNKNQKLTNKQIEYNLARVYGEINQIAQVVDGIGNMIYKYIEYKGDKDGFSKHCEYKEPKKENGSEK
tara:strand:+ start:233 stop:439 length:207 start_codon:yes stop_codon:yes gene_type:complete